MSQTNKVGSIILLLSGFGINFSGLIALAYTQGQKDARNEERISALQSRQSATEAAIMSTRQGLDDKVDSLIKAVARIEGGLERRR